MAITAQQVKELRDKTGLGMMDCKGALTEAKGDMEKAIEVLRKKGMKTAETKMGRIAREGLIGSYVHTNGKVGALVELNCETDFVARNEEFQALIKDLCMQVVAQAPQSVSPEDLPSDLVEKEKDIYRAQMKDALASKPPEVQDKILDGKLRSFYQQVCLLEQPFIREPKKTVGRLIEEKVARLQEKIGVRRFMRFEVGKDSTGASSRSGSGGCS